MPGEGRVTSTLARPAPKAARAGRPPGPSRDLCALVLLLAIATLRSLAPAWADDLPLQLEISLNGANIGLVSEVMSRDGVLFAKPSELEEMGLLVPSGVHPGPDGLISMAELPGVSLNLNLRNQSLAITASPSALRPAQLGANGRGAGLPLTPASLGAVMNYDLTGTNTGGQNTGTGLFDLRMFGLLGVLENTGIVNSTHPSGESNAVRLDSQWTYADPETLRRYTVGDTVTGGLSWNRPIRIGGLQIRTDFGLQPGLVTFALPTVTGQAALPSTADVLVNGVKQFSQQVASGPFQLRQPPAVSGAGTIQVAVTDVLGHQTIVTLPFYVSPDLLAPGRASWSFEGGESRRFYGVQSDSYRDAVGAGTLRYGVTDWLTVESHAEGMNRLEMGGLGAALRVRNWGVLSLDAAYSNGQGDTTLTAATSASQRGPGGGELVTAAFQRQATPLSFGISATRTTTGFRDLAGLTGAPIVRENYRANVGLALGKWGSFAAAVIRQIGVASTAAAPTTSTVGQTLLPITPSFEIVTASYSVQLTPELSLIGSAFGSLTGTRSFGAQIGMSYSFGPRSSGYAGISGDNSTGMSGVAQFQRSASRVGEFGVNVLAQEGGSPRRLGQADYLSPFGRGSIAVDNAPGYTAERIDLRGAIVATGAGLFPANYVDDSFAVVRSGNVSNIGVLYENRPAGRTGLFNAMVVPGLRAWESNTIALDPVDMPPDVQAGITSARVRPPEKSGVVLRFDMSRGAAAVVVLTDAAGKFLPLGSTAVVNGTGAPVVVGFDGETYLQDLHPDNTVAVTRSGASGGTCQAHFAFVPEPDSIPRIGPVVCQ